MSQINTHNPPPGHERPAENPSPQGYDQNERVGTSPAPPSNVNQPPPGQQQAPVEQSPRTTAQNSQQAVGQQQYQPPPQQQPYTNNPCCGDCALSEGVGWVAAVECIWAVANILIAGIYAGNYSAAKNNLNGKSYNNDDVAWKKWGDEHQTSLYGSLLPHIAEAVASIFLMGAASGRVRSLCFVWIGAIVLISIGEIIVVALDQTILSYISVGIILLRLYFIFIVWSLAAEIVVYPQGPPARILYTQTTGSTTYVTGPTMYNSPMVYPSYGYSPYYGGGGYYGYPYGGSAGLGFALGAGLGMGHYHGGYDSWGCDYGGYGGCDGYY